MALVIGRCGLDLIINVPDAISNGQRWYLMSRVENLIDPQVVLYLWHLTVDMALTADCGFNTVVLNSPSSLQVFG
jgi:hypothetical protein